MVLETEDVRTIYDTASRDVRMSLSSVTFLKYIILYPDPGCPTFSEYGLFYKI